MSKATDSFDAETFYDHNGNPERGYLNTRNLEPYWMTPSEDHTPLQTKEFLVDIFRKNPNADMGTVCVMTTRKPRTVVELMTGTEYEKRTIGLLVSLVQTTSAQEKYRMLEEDRTDYERIARDLGYASKKKLFADLQRAPTFSQLKE